jgi:hypothetical protein
MTRTTHHHTAAGTATTPTRVGVSPVTTSPAPAVGGGAGVHSPLGTTRPGGAGRPGLLARLLRRRRARRRRVPVPPLGPYRPSTSGSLDLAAMGARIAEAGPAASPALLAEVARRARVHGMTSPAIGVLTDTTAPDVARTRAFAVVTAGLATTSPATSRPGLRPEAAA